jgi:hypothetical protein
MNWRDFCIVTCRKVRNDDLLALCLPDTHTAAATPETAI